MVIYLLVRALSSLLLLIAIACGSLLFRLGSLPLSGADEPRYARIAEEMRDRGSPVTPLLQGIPWLEKPPLYYWVTIPFYEMFGISEASARLGPAFCALMSAIAIFWLGSTAWSRQAGLAGAAILLTSLGFAGFGRSASTDMPFTCFLTLSMTLLAAAARKDIGWKILLAYVFLGIAVLGKGPVAIVLAAGVVFFVWLLDERGATLHNWRVAPGMVVAAAVSIPWFWLAFRENGFAFIATFFINHNLARFVSGIHHHSQPFFYYLPVLLALFFPWSGWLPLLISKSPLQAIRRWREWDSPLVFLACWCLVPLVFFSLSDAKLAGYILPSLPPLALILGIQITRRVERPRLRAAAVLHFIFSAAMAVAAPWFFQNEYGGNLKVGLLISSAVLVPALFTLVQGLRGKYFSAVGATVVQGLILVAAAAQFASPVLGAYHSTRDIAGKAIQLRQPGEQIVPYRFFHHSLGYYTDYQAAAKIDDEESLARLADRIQSFLVVTDAHGAQGISAIKELTVSTLARQGNFHLLRVTRD